MCMTVFKQFICSPNQLQEKRVIFSITKSWVESDANADIFIIFLSPDSQTPGQHLNLKPFSAERQLK